MIYYTYDIGQKCMSMLWTKVGTQRPNCYYNYCENLTVCFTSPKRRSTYKEIGVTTTPTTTTNCDGNNQQQYNQLSGITQNSKLTNTYTAKETSKDDIQKCDKTRKGW